ncbi:MAG: rRNA (uracil1498-N3)-methyltransferase [Betaproteobacteria bacterium]
MTRLYIPEAIPAHGILDAPAHQAHHVAHVLRLSAGDPLTVFDGRGHEYAARIERVSKSGVTLKLGEPSAVDRESPLVVALAQGISSGERMDYTVQKAVELGVQSIQPLAMERSVVRLNVDRGAKRVQHWQAVAISACEQCGRNRVPEVMPIAAYTRWLAAAKADALRLTLSPAASLTLRDVERPAADIVLLVGPEGGLAPREQQDAKAAGFTAVRLGPRVLRTETAAVAALAAMQTLWGDF